MGSKFSGLGNPPGRLLTSLSAEITAVVATCWPRVEVAFGLWHMAHLAASTPRESSPERGTEDFSSEERRDSDQQRKFSE